VNLSVLLFSRTAVLTIDKAAEMFSLAPVPDFLDFQFCCGLQTLERLVNIGIIVFCAFLAVPSARY
jgi:hypothetical protein